MPLVKFLGFPAGASVTLAAAQDGSTSDVSVDAWGVAPPDLRLDISVRRADPQFRMAPEAIWFEADPSGFDGLTEVTRTTVLSPATTSLPDTASWGAPDYTGAQGEATDAISGSPLSAARAMTLVAREIEVPAAPRGVLWESGSNTNGAGFGFDGRGALIAFAGSGGADGLEATRVLLSLEGGALAGRSVDIVFAVRPDPGRLKLYVFDHATGEPIAVREGDIPGGLGMGQTHEGVWTNGTGMSVGVAPGPLADYLVPLDFNGTMAGGVAAWDARLPADFDTPGDVLATEADRLSADYPGVAAWGAADYTGPGGTEAGDLEAAGIDRAGPATLAVRGLEVPSVPQGIIFRTGGTGNGACLTFDPAAGVLLARVGRGDRATQDASNHIELALDASLLAGRTVDLFFAVRPDPGRLKLYVFDAGTQVPIAVVAGDTAGGAPMGFNNDGVWTGGLFAAIGRDTGAAMPGDLFAADFNGAIPNGLEAWDTALPGDFGEPVTVRKPKLYEPAFHEIFYEWDFGDTGATYGPPANVPAAFRDASRQFGKFAAHVYQQPGTYTVTCTARQVVGLDPLTVHEVSRAVEVTVGRQEDRWAAYNTVLLSADPDETWLGAPAAMFRATQNPDGSWNGLTEALEGARGANIGGAVRVLLKRGQFYAERPYSNRLFSGSGGAPKHVYYGSWGEPALPAPRIERWNENNNNGWDVHCESFVMDGVAVDGPFDPATGANNSPPGIHPAFGEGAYRLFNRMEVGGLDTAVLLSSGDPGDYLTVFNECSFSDISEYAMFGSMEHTGRLALLGCRDVDRADTVKGTSIGAPNTQGPLRISRVNDLLIDGCDFFCRHGWSPGTDWPDGTPSVAEQPCLRLGSGGSHRMRAIVTRCSGEGGGSFASVNALDTQRPPTGNVLFDMILHVSTAYRGGTFLNIGMGGATVRNTLHIQPGLPVGLARDYQQSIVFKPTARFGVTTEDQLVEPVAAYNNTLVCLQEQSAALDQIEMQGDWVQYTFANNVVYAPNVSGQLDHVDLAPFDDATLFEARYRGRLEPADAGVLKTQYATPDGVVSLYRPLAGSPVVGAASAGVASVFDLLGDRRGEMPSAGAVEPE